ncbi:MAG: hypothetical protein GQ547_00355 [Methylophaga sp.]|nr:hypothetical protein [Methylophaga sp.]
MDITYLDDFYLAGAKFYQLPWVINELKLGTEMKLIPDPENRYDENAVIVQFNDHKLGFIPRANNTNLQKLLLANVNIIARISVLNPQEEQWKQVKITLYIVSEKVMEKN